MGQAAEVLRAGGLVAFPTETVYGLGADARNETAVTRIFSVKGRPATHPLIVHIENLAATSAWARDVPDIAKKLGERFWPGPLTLVLRRAPSVPDIVTGGLDTVALRVPAHPMAQALLSAFGGGIAAPSANRFGRVSPTTAAHVREDIGSDCDCILDGGPCRVGIESTIVDLSSGAPAILRPGGVPKEDIEAVLGHTIDLRTGGPVRAPGQYSSHYAPHAELVIAESNSVHEQAEKLRAKGLRVVELATIDGPTLYAQLREADRLAANTVVVASPEQNGLGLAIADRLRRAAAPRGNSGT